MEGVCMAADPDRIPMRELERLTGVTRMTINFYIKEGLLPEPRKTARNMAYYNQDYVERLKLIIKLRSQHNLPLAQIKHILQGAHGERDLGLMMDVRDRLFHQSLGNREENSVTWKELADRTGLDEDTLQKMLSMNLLYPDENGSKGADQNASYHYHSDSIVIGQLVRRILELGITLEEIEPMTRALKEIADLEVELYNRYLANLPEAADWSWDDVLELSSSFISLAHLRNLYERIPPG